MNIFIKNSLIFSSLLFATQCTTKEDTKHDEVKVVSENTVILTTDQVKSFGIEVGQLQPKTMSNKIIVNGKLDVPPQNLVTISAPLGGFVKSTHLLQGMHVRKGETLASLEDPAYIQMQQDYMEAASKLAYAKTEYERQKTLATENINAQKTVQHAKSDFETLRAQVSGLEAKLKFIHIDPAQLQGGKIQPFIKIQSPIAGYVTEVNVNIGQYVTATQALFKIVDNSHLHAELYVFEQDVPKLAIDQKMAFTLINDTTTRTASIHLIGREISADRTVRVHCHLDDEEDHSLIPGMYIKATIITDAHEANVLIEEAVVNFEGTNYVFITNDEKTFQLQKVNADVNQDGFTAVDLKPTNDTRKIVVKGAYILLSKLKNTEEEE